MMSVAATSMTGVAEFKDDLRNRLEYRRSRSFYHPSQALDERPDIEEMAILKLDHFLNKLTRRLDGYEASFDSRMGMAHDTLLAVKNRCGKMGDEIIGEGRRRAETLITILEQRYNDAWTASESLPRKVNAGMKILEDMMVEIENRGFARMDRTLRRIELMDNQLQSSTERAARKMNTALLAAKQRLLTYDELPIQWQENEYIVRGYRFYETKIECVKSIASIHNETFNIWSHLLGFVVMLALAVYFYPGSPSFKMSTTADKILVSVFMIAALKCLAASFIWHTFCNISCLRTMQSFACLDYTAISTLIACSLVTMEYSGFYCQPYLQSFYMTLTTVLGTIGTILPWYEWFDKKENRALRILFYIGLSASGALPLIHLSIARNPIATFFFFKPMIKSVLSYIVGLFVYANRFPERIWLGVFDLTGGSHCIWHICVFLGILFHYQALHEFLGGASEFSCTLA